MPDTILTAPRSISPKIKSLENLFQFATEFNGDISDWDTSNVTNMSGMFKGAVKFNQPIGSWNVENVTNMSYMFQNAVLFNQPIIEWNTGKVTNMSGMFYGATIFNKSLATWDVKNVTDISDMFNNTHEFVQDNFSNWSPLKVVNMDRMFYSSLKFNGNLTSWNLTSVKSHAQFDENTPKWEQKNKPEFYS